MAQEQLAENQTALFQAFGQTVSIALTSLAQVMELTGRFERSLVVGYEPKVQEIALELGNHWAEVWSQLDQARKIAVSFQRDVAAYDAASAKVVDKSPGVIRYEVLDYHPTTFIPGQQVKYTTDGRRAIVWMPLNTQPAVDALTAMRAAIPEAPMPTSQPSAEVISLAPARGKLYAIVGVIIAIIVVAILIARR